MTRLQLAVMVRTDAELDWEKVRMELALRRSAVDKAQKEYDTCVAKEKFAFEMYCEARRNVTG